MCQEHNLKQVEKLEVLGLLLSKPDDFLITSIRENKLAEVLATVFPSEDWSRFSQGEYTQELLKYISRDYLYLFVGVSKPLASPYMSSYYRANSRLMDVPARNMLALMKKWGIEVDDEYRDLPDHFATVISLMSTLIKISFELKEEVLKAELTSDIEKLANDACEFLPKVIEKVSEFEKVEYYSIILSLANDEMEKLRQYEMQ